VTIRFTELNTRRTTVQKGHIMSLQEIAAQLKAVEVPENGPRAVLNELEGTRAVVQSILTVEGLGYREIDEAIREAEVRLEELEAFMQEIKRRLNEAASRFLAG
jgi:DNA repair exonuclease SbcCD ATPase subunit